MVTAIKIALLFALLSSTAFVICFIPVVWHLRRQVDRVIEAAEEMKSDVHNMLRETRALIHTVTELAGRINGQMEELEAIAHMLRQWVERVDRLTRAVGSVVEPPVLAIGRQANIFRSGATAFLRALIHPSHHHNNNQEESHD